MGLVACSNQDEPLAPETLPVSLNLKVSNDTKNIAQLMTSIPLTEEIVSEVFFATQNGLENGIEESYYFADVLSATSAKSANKVSVRKNSPTLGQEIRLALSKTRTTNQVDTDLLQFGNYQIYWPYSENWDGKTLPVITFVPENENQSWNYGYKQTENGVETVVVDEEYMESNPVWIINKADFSYEDLPNFNNNEHVKNGVYYCPRKVIAPPNTHKQGPAKVEGIPVYTVYLGKLMSSKQYDSIWAGGSEFAIQMGAIEKVQITSKEQLYSTSPEITYFKVTRSRKDIRKKRWAELGVILSSDWYPNENNAGFCIYEEDQGETETFDMSLSVNINGKDESFTIKMPFGSGDDMIYKTVYSKNFIFSTNNMNGDTPVVHSSGEVYWTLPFKVGKTIL